MRIEKPKGVTFYYRTLPDGNEMKCGARLDLNQIPSERIAEMIQSHKDISLTLIFDGKLPFSYTPEDLGQSPRREKMLMEIAKVAPTWCNTIIIMEKGSKDISRRPE